MAVPLRVRIVGGRPLAQSGAGAGGRDHFPPNQVIFVRVRSSIGLPAALTTIALVLSACSAGDGGSDTPAPTQTSPSAAATTPSDTASPSEGASAGASASPSTGETAVIDGTTCTNPRLGYQVSFPEGWNTNAEETDTVPACSLFDPEPVEVPEDGDTEPTAAVTLFIDPVPFADVASPPGDADAASLERFVTTVSARKAFLQVNAEGGDNSDQGSIASLYAIDIGDEQTLFATTGGQQGSEEAAALDQIVASLVFDPSVGGGLDQPVDGPVVGRYESGGQPLTGFATPDGCFTVRAGGDEEKACDPQLDGAQISAFGVLIVEATIVVAAPEAARIAVTTSNGDTQGFVPITVSEQTRAVLVPIAPGSITAITALSATGEEVATSEGVTTFNG